MRIEWCEGSRLGASALVCCVAVVACQSGPATGGEVGDPGEGPCEVVSTSPLDTQAQMKVMALEGSYKGELSFSSGATSVGVSLQMSLNAIPERVHYQPLSAGAVCEDQVRATLDLAFDSSDGQFKETAEYAALTWRDENSFLVHAESTASATLGTFDASKFTSSELLKASLEPYLMLALEQDASNVLSGDLYLHLQAREGTFENGMSTMKVAVGTLTLSARSIEGLGAPCLDGDLCRQGQTCMAGAEFKSCELDCSADTDCPKGWGCNLPPVQPDSLANVCIRNTTP